MRKLFYILGIITLFCISVLLYLRLFQTNVIYTQKLVQLEKERDLLNEELANIKTSLFNLLLWVNLEKRAADLKLIIAYNASSGAIPNISFDQPSIEYAVSYTNHKNVNKKRKIID